MTRSGAATAGTRDCDNYCGSEPPITRNPDGGGGAADDCVNVTVTPLMVTVAVRASLQGFALMASTTLARLALNVRGGAEM